MRWIGLNLVNLSICLIAAAHGGGAIAADDDGGAGPAAESNFVEANIVEAADPGYDAPPSVFEIGRAALLAKDYATAYQSLRIAGEQGDPLAQSALGDMYLAGQGVDADHAEALRWYLSAAKQGD